jgi:hypothetical protein
LTTLVYPTTLVAGANENVNDLNSNLNAITAVVNGAIDSSNIANAGVSANNLSTAVAQQLGVTNVANTGRGKSIIAATESRTNVAYGTMTTPDQVTGIVLPTDGLIFIAFQGTWQNSVASAAGAAIFLGANEVKASTTGFAAPQTLINTGVGPTGTGSDASLSSFPLGLISSNSTSYSGDVTTGQIVGIYGTTHLAVAEGGPCAIFAAAGTYTVSVQFKASSGSVTVKNRKLWVWTQGFG